MSLAQYEALMPNMFYGRVLQILGCPGTEMSSSHIAGHATYLYKWDGAAALSNMNVTIQNGHMVGKAQFGLR